MLIAQQEGVDAIIHLAGEGVASGSGPLAIIGRYYYTQHCKPILNCLLSPVAVIASLFSNAASSLSQSNASFQRCSGDFELMH
jgi:hypothetical protein